MDILLAYFGGIVTGVLGVVLWAACVASVPTVPGAHVGDEDEDDDDLDDWTLTPEDEEFLLKWERR